MSGTSSSGPSCTGHQSIDSVRGASSAHQNPFLVLRREHTTEATGEALGLSLVHSGNFLADVEVDHWGVTAGAHRHQPRWLRVDRGAGR